jgi:hypothetical protein
MNTISRVFPFILAATLLGGCAGQQTTAQLLKDQKKKAELIEALCSDPGTASEVAEQMAKTPACIQTITANNSLIRQLTSEGNLSGMLKSDTATTYNLMADLVMVSSKDSVATYRLVAYVLGNSEMRAEVKRQLHEKGNSGKDKKHKEHKDHKEKGSHHKANHPRA